VTDHVETYRSNELQVLTTEGTAIVEQTTQNYPTQQSSGFVNMNVNEMSTQIQNTTVHTINERGENNAKEDDQFLNSKIIFKI
jgi:hypothetical protein